MINIIKRSIGLITAVILALAPLTVYALSSDPNPFSPDGGYVNVNMSDDSFLAYKVGLENFCSSYDLNVDDYYFYYGNSGSNYTWIFPKDSATITYAHDGSDSVPILYSDTWAMSTLDRPISWQTNNYSSFFVALKYQNGTYDITNIYNSSGVLTPVFPSGTSAHCFISYVNPPFTPNYSSRVLTGIDLSINENDFVQWIIDNDKVGELPAYIGLSKLRSFVSFYKSYGGSNTSFLGYISQWFAKMNIVAQSTENINILKKSIDKLYQEYLNSYMKTFYDNSANQVHHRRNITTNTDDTDLTLVTDDSNDTIDVSILRDILRAIIQFQTTFADYMERLFAKIDNLDFVTTVVNDGGNTNPIDLSSLYIYDPDAFANDLQNFESSIEDVQSVPQGYIDTINQNSLMPENMLQDKTSLTVNIPTITGFTVGNNGSTYSTQTGTHVISSTDYPWLDSIVQKIKRFASIILILGYLVHLRYRIPELIRGE